jgi:hypothetical protein
MDGLPPPLMTVTNLIHREAALLLKTLMSLTGSETAQLPTDFYTYKVQILAFRGPTGRPPALTLPINIIYFKCKVLYLYFNTTGSKQRWADGHI